MNNRLHNGLARDIRLVLERSSEPLSAYKISLALGIRHSKVQTALITIISRTGGIVSIKTHRGVLYTVYGRAPKQEPKKSGQLAGPITIPQYVYGGTRLG